MFTRAAFQPIRPWDRPQQRQASPYITAKIGTCLKVDESALLAVGARDRDGPARERKLAESEEYEKDCERDSKRTISIVARLVGRAFWEANGERVYRIRPAGDRARGAGGPGNSRDLVLGGELHGGECSVTAVSGTRCDAIPKGVNGSAEASNAQKFHSQQELKA
jgi:hypothetical protein